MLFEVITGIATGLALGHYLAWDFGGVLGNDRPTARLLMSKVARDATRVVE